MTGSSRLLAKARLENLSDIRDFVDGAAGRAGLSGQSLSDLLVAVDEAATNTIQHGYKGREGDIEISVARRDDALVVTLRDDAPPFDPTGVGHPDFSESLLTRPPGGMGVHLMRTLSDSLSHRVTQSGGNETILVKKIPQQ